MQVYIGSSFHNPFVTDLALQMPEEEAFCVLVQIMHRYGLRDYFIPQSNFLSQRLYQFSVLVSENLPHISRHLEFQGIQDNMYAARWFTSLFACKFPFEFVFRVYDLFLSEGQDVLLRVALAVLNQNQATILALEHDNLLRFLKNDLVDISEVKRAFQCLIVGQWWFLIFIYFF